MLRLSSQDAEGLIDLVDTDMGALHESGVNLACYSSRKITPQSREHVDRCTVKGRPMPIDKSCKFYRDASLS